MENFVSVLCGKHKRPSSLDNATVRRCLAEIRDLGPERLASWRRLHNGMSVGEFSYVYVRHYRNAKNARYH